MKDINHMIISVDAEKALEKNKHLFMKKNSQQSGYRGNIIQHIKPYITNQSGEGLWDEQTG